MKNTFDFASFKKDVTFETLTVQVSQEEAPYINTTSNTGTIKVNTLACKILNIPYGKVNVEKGGTGVRIDFRRQNFGGTESIVTFLQPIGSKSGAKLASPSKQNGGILQCSTSNCWYNLGGNLNSLVYYTISANDNAVLFNEDAVCTLEQAQDGGMIENGMWTALAESEGIAAEGSIATVYYRLSFSKDEQKRESKATGRPSKKTSKKKEAAEV